MYVKLDNNHQPVSFPYSLTRFRNDNPDTSFPETISDEILESYDVFRVSSTTAPTYDPKTQRIEKGVRQVNNRWEESWTVENLPEGSAADNVRGYRKKLLDQTDYTQLADAPGDTAAWATYRQALRDIPAQDGFPFTVTWPTEPS